MTHLSLQQIYDHLTSAVDGGHRVFELREDTVEAVAPGGRSCISLRFRPSPADPTNTRVEVGTNDVYRDLPLEDDQEPPLLTQVVQAAINGEFLEDVWSDDGNVVKVEIHTGPIMLSDSMGPAEIPDDDLLDHKQLRYDPYI